MVLNYNHKSSELSRGHPELAGMKRGDKQLWLRLHHKEVEDYYLQHGFEATMAEYNLVKKTLTRFLNRKYDDRQFDRLSQADRSVMAWCRQGLADIRREVRDLQDWRAEATPVIAVGRALIEATMAKAPALSEDPLNIKQLSGKLKK